MITFSVEIQQVKGTKVDVGVTILEDKSSASGSTQPEIKVLQDILDILNLYMSSGTVNEVKQSIIDNMMKEGRDIAPKNNGKK